MKERNINEKTETKKKSTEIDCLFEFVTQENVKERKKTKKQKQIQ